MAEEEEDAEHEEEKEDEVTRTRRGEKRMGACGHKEDEGEEGDGSKDKTYLLLGDEENCRGLG